ncbi:hypothetical protein [Herbihabitans rhizosphaerae]|uniref:hypothetical protein n=1 Tax=Herbihabitans rhizosphaerae TaxID=1872711 RepID=UPI001A92E805|nr:hypothetical protein [Herbihabitans rhizosphaerae]
MLRELRRARRQRSPLRWLSLGWAGVRRLLSGRHGSARAGLLSLRWPALPRVPLWWLPLRRPALWLLTLWLPLRWAPVCRRWLSVGSRRRRHRAARATGRPRWLGHNVDPRSLVIRPGPVISESDSMISRA